MTGEGPSERIIPPGDDKPRLTCRDCGFIDYENPKIVVIAVAVHGDRFLLARRAIEPRVGFWTIPGGFMEKGETLQEGAARETREEAGAEVDVGSLIAIYQTPDKKNVMMIFRAEMKTPNLNPGPESLEAKLFRWDEIPWNDLAFPMVKEALETYQKTKHLKEVSPDIRVMPRMNPPLPPQPAPRFKPPRP